jgi:GNAT superfamily N-acetyltransferase
MRVRRAERTDELFVVEMARIAATLADRPLPAADDPVVLACLPRSPSAAVIAVDGDGERLGAAWWHVHEPPLVCDAGGVALPELVMAVRDGERGRGVGTALVEAVAVLAADTFDVITLNVHLLNPAVRLYLRTGFNVAGVGRGLYGVALRRSLR